MVRGTLPLIIMIFEGKESHYYHPQEDCVPSPDFMNENYMSELPKVTQLVGMYMMPSSVPFPLGCADSSTLSIFSYSILAQHEDKEHD